MTVRRDRGKREQSAEVRSEVRSVDVLAALERLDDAGLRAAIARAQGLLLDRPVLPDCSDGLAVEIVDRAEGAVLMAYRALDVAGQRQVRAHVGRLVPQGRLLEAEPAPAVRQQRHRGHRGRVSGDGHDAIQERSRGVLGTGGGVRSIRI